MDNQKKNYRGKRILALIPARSGSKGLPDKNIMSFAGKPLMAHTIETALASDCFNTVFVSTDSEDYAAIARGYGAAAPFLRSSETAGDRASSWSVLDETIQALTKRGHTYDIAVLLQTTSPLRTAADILAGVNKLISKQAAAVVSVCPADHLPFWTNTLPPDECLEDFIGSENLSRRQEFPAYYRINGAFYGIDLHKTTRYPPDLYSSRSFALIMPKERSVDIDDIWDFICAESYYRHLHKIT